VDVYERLKNVREKAAFTLVILVENVGEKIKERLG